MGIPVNLNDLSTSAFFQINGKIRPGTIAFLVDSNNELINFNGSAILFRGSDGGDRFCIEKHSILSSQEDIKLGEYEIRITDELSMYRIRREDLPFPAEANLKSFLSAHSSIK